MVTLIIVENLARGQFPFKAVCRAKGAKTNGGDLVAAGGFGSDRQHQTPPRSEPAWQSFLNPDSATMPNQIQSRSIFKSNSDEAERQPRRHGGARSELQTGSLGVLLVTPTNAPCWSALLFRVWHFDHLQATLFVVTTSEFQILFCQRFGCPLGEYQERAFRQCLYWHAKPLAPVLRKLNPNFFAEDFKFIRYLGDANGMREARANAADFRDGVKRSFLRNTMKIRVSGRKATRLAETLFLEARRRAKAPEPKV